MPGSRQPIDSLSCAESVITLLDLLHIEKLPPEEQAALATVQTQAIEEWLTASPLPFAGDQSSFEFEPSDLPNCPPKELPADG